MSKYFVSRSVIATVLIAGGVYCAPAICGAEKLSPNVTRLVEESAKKEPVLGSWPLVRKVSGNVESWDHANPLRDSDVPEALLYIKRHTDYTSYHLLMALRKFYPASYKTVSNKVKSAILCSALQNVIVLNDWGYLDTLESYDAESAKALLATGRVALTCLGPLLDDNNPAPHMGTQEATLSHAYFYRRKDFAYRYASLILGKKPVFHREHKERDKDIESLKAELKRAVPAK